MHRDNRDFYNHPPRGLPHAVIGMGLLITLLVAAYAWSQSSYADQYRAQKIAQAEAQFGALYRMGYVRRVGEAAQITNAGLSVLDRHERKAWSAA